MRLFCSLIFFTLIQQLTNCQTLIDFNGVIATKQGFATTIKVSLNQTAPFIFKGFSFTDVEGPNYTKSSVEVSIDTLNKTFSFKELKNLYTSSEAQASTFCYIQANKMNYVIENGKTIVSGNFEGLYQNGEICATGTFLLSSTYNVEDLQSKNNQTNLKNNITEDIYISSNNTIELDGTESPIMINLWDGGIEDNDQVLVISNQLKKEHKVTLKKRKRTITVPQSDQNASIKITALDIGRSGVNTMNFSVHQENGSLSKSYVSKLKKGQSFQIIIKRN